MTHPIDLDRRTEQETRVLAVRVELIAQGQFPSAAAVARRLGWGPHLAEEVVRRLRARGLWPESALPYRPRRDHNAHAAGGTGKERPDIAAECAKIRADWTEFTERSRRVGHRAGAPVPTGIDHYQRLLTHKYKGN